MADALKFTRDHLWLRVEDNRAHLGVSDHGQVQMGEIIALELPDVGDHLERGQAFGEIESVRTVSELVAPASGVVTAVNTDLEDHPNMVNEDPYHDGWLLEFELVNESEIEDLMDPDEYDDYVGEED